MLSKSVYTSYCSQHLMWQNIVKDDIKDCLCLRYSAVNPLCSILRFEINNDKKISKQSLAALRKWLINTVLHKSTTFFGFLVIVVIKDYGSVNFHFWFQLSFDTFVSSCSHPSEQICVLVSRNFKKCASSYV